METDQQPNVTDEQTGNGADAGEKAWLAHWCSPP